jgi:hypothetical protein
MEISSALSSYVAGQVTANSEASGSGDIDTGTLKKALDSQEQTASTILNSISLATYNPAGQMNISNSAGALLNTKA